MAHWNYLYEVNNFKRHDDGSCSYSTREEGNIPYVPITSQRSSSLFMLGIWGKARRLAERTGKDITAYATGRKVCFEQRPQST